MFHNISINDQEKFNDLVFRLNENYNIITRNEFHMFLDGKLKNNEKKSLSPLMMVSIQTSL